MVLNPYSYHDSRYLQFETLQDYLRNEQNRKDMNDINAYYASGTKMNNEEKTIFGVLLPPLLYLVLLLLC